MSIIEFYETTKKRSSAEVTFPIYRKHDLMIDECDCIIFSRREEDGTEYSIVRITRVSKDTEFEFEIKHFDKNNFVTGDKDYALGLNEHACTAKEFYDVVYEVKTFLEKISRGV